MAFEGRKDCTQVWICNAPSRSPVPETRLATVAAAAARKASVDALDEQGAFLYGYVASVYTVTANLNSACYFYVM